MEFNGTTTTSASDRRLIRINRTRADEEVIQLGRQALARQGRVWNDWMTIAEAIAVGRREVLDKLNSDQPNGQRYHKAMDEWLVTSGFKGIDKSTRSRLLECLEHRAEIEKWRTTLTEPERLRYNYPYTVLQRWKARTQVITTAPKRKSSVRALEDAVAKLDEENFALRRQLEMKTIPDTLDILRFQPHDERNQLNADGMKAVAAADLIYMRAWLSENSDKTKDDWRDAQNGVEVRNFVGAKHYEWMRQQIRLFEQAKTSPIPAQLFFGDCLEEMNKIEDESVDFVFADLPYGTTACKWDIPIPFDLLWSQLNRVCKKNAAMVFTATMPFGASLIESNRENFKYDVIWEKHQGTNPMHAERMPLRSHESVLVFYRAQPTYNPQMESGKPYAGFSSTTSTIGEIYGSGKSVHRANPTGQRFPKTIIRFKQEKGLHPTQKPVPLLEYLIRTYSNHNAVVLDPTMGSGTTGVAAINLDRQFIGIESDEGYFNCAKDRINETHIKRSHHQHDSSCTTAC